MLVLADHRLYGELRTWVLGLVLACLQSGGLFFRFGGFFLVSLDVAALM